MTGLGHIHVPEEILIIAKQGGFKLRNTLYKIRSKLRNSFRWRFNWRYNLRSKMSLPQISIPRKLTLRLTQTAISILFLMLVVGVFQMENQVAQKIQGQIRTTFSSENDYSTAIREYLTFGWWLNSYDRMVFRQEQEPEAVPAMSSPSYQLVNPVSGRVTQRFGTITSEATGEEYFHSGIDIEAAIGTPIKAVKAGVIVRITEDNKLGRLVQVDHGDGFYSLYANCSEILVQEGQEVEQGQVIAKVGQTGDASSPQLHFELRKEGQLIDPLTMLPVSGTGI